MAVEPPTSVTRLVRIADPPTAPPKVVVPVVLAVRLNAPLTVSANVIAPLPASSRVLAPSVTASLKNWLSPLLVLIEPPSMAVVPPALVSRCVSAVFEPTAPLNFVAPVVLASRR